MIHWVRLLEILKALDLHDVLLPAACCPFLDLLQWCILGHRNPDKTSRLTEVLGSNASVSVAQRSSIGNHHSN